MLQKLIKKNNYSIQKAISEVTSEGLRNALGNIKRLEGEKLKNFINIFNLQFVTEPEIYYNNFNIMICEKHIYDQLSSYFKKDTLVMRVEFPKLDTNIWCHEIFQDALFYNLLDDVEDSTI